MTTRRSDYPQIQFRVTTAVYTEVKRRAAQEGTSPSLMAKALLLEYLDEAQARGRATGAPPAQAERPVKKVAKRKAEAARELTYEPIEEEPN